MVEPPCVAKIRLYGVCDLKEELEGELHDSRAQSCGGRAEGCCTDVLGNKAGRADDAADARRCGARELGGAQVRNICPIQNVEGFADELQAFPLLYRHGAGHAWIYRN